MQSIIRIIDKTNDWVGRAVSFLLIPLVLITAFEVFMRYVVQRGDALGEIAAQFGTSIRQVQRLNGISNPNRIYPGQVLLVARGNKTLAKGEPSSAPSQSSSPARETVIYTVSRGDSLISIAKRYQTSAASLQALNGISNPNRIYPGMKLTVRPGQKSASPKQHVVRRGETLERIARKYGSSIIEIQNANGIRNPNRIRRGQKLLIP